MGMEEKNGMMMSHYMNERPIFPAISPQPQPPHHDLHYAMVMLGGGGGGGGMLFGGSDSTIINGLGSVNSSGDGGGNIIGEIGGCGNGRWPKEETLILLEIRSRLDSKFKEATHKTPLWDEVSRIMCVEYGYKRTGKNCSEKFENLYKYYKKIKEGRAGRQDKKHYRFFRQLEAIYGETSARINRDPNLPSSHNDNNDPYGFISQSSSLDFKNRDAKLPPLFMNDSDYCVDKKTINERKPPAKKHNNWNTIIADFIETKMKTLMEKQDAWMEKMMNTIDQKEKERILKEEQWRNEEISRLESKKKFHLNERARMVSRDSALMEALHKLTAIGGSNHDDRQAAASSHKYCNDHQSQIVTDWGEDEITQLIRLRSSMETRFGQGGSCMEELLWEEIALTMSCLGYNRNALTCKAKWDQTNFLLRTKKRKENTAIRCSNTYTDRRNYMYNQAVERSDAQNDPEINGGGYKVLNMGDDPEIMWNCYGMKMTKGEKPFPWP